MQNLRYYELILPLNCQHLNGYISKFVPNSIQSFATRLLDVNIASYNIQYIHIHIGKSIY